MSTSQQDLRDIARAEFARVGYTATSLQHIAELAGLSKSSVLYHYSSKEALLEAVLTPAIDSMELVLKAAAERGLLGANREPFLAGFVDLLLAYRLELNIFINQGPSLVDVPVIDRVNLLVMRLAEFFNVNTDSLEERMRFGIALGGAAYMLCTIDAFGLAVESEDETRVALVTILSDLLTPINR